MLAGEEVIAGGQEWHIHLATVLSCRAGHFAVSIMAICGAWCLRLEDPDCFTACREVGTCSK